MKLKKQKIKADGIKFFWEDNKKEIGRGYLYLIKNELHKNSFGFIEDVFIDEKNRSQGLGKRLVKEMIETAKKKKCYKLILTSRYSKPKVHELYASLGFKDHGKEFRINFKK